MRAAYIDKPMSIKYITDAPEPQIKKDNEVKIRVKITGICGSEVHAFHGEHPFRIPPVISGHEFAGEVVEIGDKVSKIKVGDRVTIEPQYGCGGCAYCKNGKHNVCINKTVLGSNSWSGSFGEYIVAPEETVISIPNNVTYEQAVLIEPLAVGLHLVRRSKLLVGQTVAIIGAGTIGLGILVSAKLAGAKNIIISDISDFNLKIAKELGATNCMNSSKENAIEKFKEYSKGYDIDVIYTAADSKKAFKTALDIASPDGLIASVVTPDGQDDMNCVIQKELRIIGSLMYVREEFEIVRDKIADGSINVTPLISKVKPIEDVAKAFEIADKRTEDVIKILLRF